MKQKMKINLIEVRNHVKIILLMLAICTLVMSFISGIFIFEKKINEKKERIRIVTSWATPVEEATKFAELIRTL